MKIVSERLRHLRESIKLSQVKLAKLMGSTQASVNRYESDSSSPSQETFLWYADYFDVSLDYIFGRTNMPQGKLYDYYPKIEKTSEEMRQFVEMCFDPQSPLNDRLKQTLLEMLGETKR
jgi:transcriptional regulator with XRE-family HTH domain